MEKEKYAQCLSIMAQVDESEWYRDENYLIQFHNPEKMPREVLEAAKLLNQNYIESEKEWGRFTDLYGNEPFMTEFDENDPDY